MIESRPEIVTARELQWRRGWRCVGVIICVSKSVSRASRRWLTKNARAALEASVRRWNIDSPAKKPAESDAINAARQLAVLPGLDAVGEPDAVQASIGIEHRIGDPGPFDAVGAAVHDLVKRWVNRELKLPLAKARARVGVKWKTAPGQRSPADRATTTGPDSRRGTRETRRTGRLRIRRARTQVAADRDQADLVGQCRIQQGSHGNHLGYPRLREPGITADYLIDLQQRNGRVMLTEDISHRSLDRLTTTALDLLDLVPAATTSAFGSLSGLVAAFLALGALADDARSRRSLRSLRVGNDDPAELGLVRKAR